MTIHGSRPVDSASPAQGKNTMSEMPKLKASCNTCAASKVRCTKERPVCSRCAKRGENCIYLASKRAGRVARTRSRSSRDVQQVDQPHNESDGGQEPSLSPSSPSVRDNGPSPASPTQTAFPPENVTSLNMLPLPENSSSVPTSTAGVLAGSDMDDFLASLNEEPKSACLLTSINEESEIDNFFASLNGKPEEIPDIFDPNSLYGETFSGWTDSLTALNGTSNFLFNPLELNPAIHGATSELPAATQPGDSPSNPNFHLHNEEALPTTGTKRKCDCMATSAKLFTRLLFADAGSSVCSTVAQDVAKTTLADRSQLTAVEVIIPKNEECIELMYTMLRCQCTQNSYMLNLLAMLVLKVLAWYAAAVRIDSVVPADDEMTGPDHSHFEQRGPAAGERLVQFSTKAGNYSISGTKDSRRMTAQLVLSQLHRVQGLVNQIARRFTHNRQLMGQEQLDDVSTDQATSGNDDVEKSFDSIENFDSPFSHNTLEQLESDLRRRLRNVWLEMKRIVLEE